MSITDDVRVVPGPDRDGGGSFGEPAFDRTPPQDIAAEQCVLGGMLLSKDAIADVVEILRSADFYRPTHATIFDTVLDLYGRGEPADPITVAAALTDCRRPGPRRRRALPAHADLVGADGRQLRVLRQDRRRAGGAAPAGRGRHADRRRWATARPPGRAATSTTSSTWPSRPSTT